MKGEFKTNLSLAASGLFCSQLVPKQQQLRDGCPCVLRLLLQTFL